MFTVFRWLVRLVTALAALAALAAIVAYAFAVRSLPDYDANRSVAGIAAPVEIVRTTHNVPHVFATTDADAFFGLGYAHAQDRLWQMTLLRRTVQGRLSELFGPRTLPVDEAIRRLDLYGAATRSVAAQDAYATAALEAYAAGVNAWIETVAREALGRGSPEFWLFPPEIAPWQPADSIAIVKLMALQLTPQIDAEVLRARVGLVLPPERLRDILPDAPGPAVAELPEYAALFPGATFDMVVGPDAADAPLTPFRPARAAGASNAWAAGPSRAVGAGALLANDPHLGLTAPSIWYLARLDLAEGGVIGATIPGVPLVMSGRSDRLGWGLTSSYMDDLDLFIEEVNPDNPDQVRTPDGWADMPARETIIEVAGAAPVTLTLRFTQNGPVLPATLFDLGSVTPPGHVVSVAWSALSPADTTLTAGFRLMRSGTIEDAIAAGEFFIAPSQNLVLADRTRVAMQMVGAMPARDPAHQSQGRLPAPGWRAENRWLGRLPYADNPSFVDPPGGIVGNTNNRLVDTAFPNHVSHTWGDTQRVQRWQRLMQARQVHTRESFVEAQVDTVAPDARTLLPLVAADLWFTGEAADEGTPERRRQRALALLAEWNGEMNEHLPEPLIYAAWMRALQQRLIQDELGPLAREFPSPDPLFVERVYRDVGGAARWCDVIQSAPEETCTDMARLALDDALVWIAGRFGGGIESLRWGDAHVARHDHTVLGEVPGLSWIANIRQSSSGWDQTLNRGQTTGTDPDPFANVAAAGYRGVYSLSDPNASLFVIATGQSGHMLSRHYDDMSVLWRLGEYIPMSLDEGLARAGAVGVTVLSPAP
ncbi:MAG: penicillin acylase family protein [Rhodobacteraceae bacterium]|jgi:penicillin amidase|nr:penicillin acylase family protein [Paracoccaceae bacterium]